MVDVISISDDISIPYTELQLSAVRSSGAGGQNVNKVATAIHLHFDAANSPSLNDRVKERLLSLDDRRISPDGVIVIKAQEHRTQERNRKAAIERLRDLILIALVERKPRKATRPSKRAVRRRVDNKRQRGELKQTRKKTSDD
jgi:ribosome-associated protein